MDQLADQLHFIKVATGGQGPFKTSLGRVVPPQASTVVTSGEFELLVPKDTVTSSLQSFPQANRLPLRPRRSLNPSSYFRLLRLTTTPFSN